MGTKIALGHTCGWLVILVYGQKYQIQGLHTNPMGKLFDFVSKI
jgi:hypothetical protein